MVNHEICPDCGHQVQKFVVRQTITQSVFDAFQRVLSLEGIFTAIALAIPRALGVYIWIFDWIYLAALAGYYFVIIRHVGDSHDGMPTPSDTMDDYSGTLSRAWRGIVCYVVGFLPLIIWITYQITHADPMPQDSAWAMEPVEPVEVGDPMSVGTLVLTILGLVLVGQLYMPAVILSVALTNTTFAAVWPPTWIKVIARAPGQYVRFAAVWIGSLLVGVGLSISTAILFPPNLIGHLIVAFLWCMFWFAQAVLVGNYIRENASAFGWDQTEGPADDYAIPAARVVSLPPVHRPAASTGTTKPPPMAEAPEVVRGKLAFAIRAGDLTAGGIDARREDGTAVLVLWKDVVGVVARRLPPAYDGATFVDVVSTAGSTVRILPWTRLTGETVDGDEITRARAFVQRVVEHCPSVQLDRATRAFLGGESGALQLPDVATLALHDDKLA